MSYNQISDISSLSEMTNMTRLWLHGNPLNVEAYCTYLPLIRNNNPSIDLLYDPNPYPDCDEDGTPDACDEDAIDIDGDGIDDGEGVGHGCDNCPDHYNPDQEDTMPLGGNSDPLGGFYCGDACECEGDFEPDGDVDGTDAFALKNDFFRKDCSINSACNGDFECDGDVDGTDAVKFKADFFRKDCPSCGGWPCVYE